MFSETYLIATWYNQSDHNLTDLDLPYKLRFLRLCNTFYLDCDFYTGGNSYHGIVSSHGSQFVTVEVHVRQLRIKFMLINVI